MGLVAYASPLCEAHLRNGGPRRISRTPPKWKANDSVRPPMAGNGLSLPTTEHHVQKKESDPHSATGNHPLLKSKCPPRISGRLLRRRIDPDARSSRRASRW